MTTLICTSLTSKDVSQAREEILQARAEGADLAEVRLDLMEDSTGWPSLLPTTPLPLIITNRPTWEGGRSTQDESARHEELIKAVKLGADYIDIELMAANEFLPKLCTLSECRTKIIISYHNFQRSLSLAELCDLCEQMKSLKADVCKVVMMASSVKDNEQVFDFLREREGNVICIAMGEFGTLSRLLAGKFGSFITYTALSKGNLTAPGQVSTKEMKESFALNFINPSTTDIYGFLRESLDFDFNFKLINLVFRKLGLNKVCVPVRFSSSEDVGLFLKTLADKFDFAGFVCAPHDRNIQTKLGNLCGKGCAVDVAHVVRKDVVEYVGCHIGSDMKSALDETDQLVLWYIELLKNLTGTDLTDEVERCVRLEIAAS